MAETVRMPKWGLTMEEGTIVEWSVPVGQPVEKGQRLAVVESEKVEVDLEAPVSGVVTAHLVEAGETVPVGAGVALIAPGS